MSELPDDELLDVLAGVLASDEPFPVTLAEQVEHDAFAMRRIDAELAELLYDTGLEATVAVRGDGPRLVSFAASGHELDVELRDDDTMVGQVSPPTDAVSVESSAGAVVIETDHLGRFTTATPSARLRFVIASAAAPAATVVTPWIFR